MSDVSGGGRQGRWLLAIVLLVAAAAVIAVFFLLTPRVLAPMPTPTASTTPTPSSDPGVGVPEDQNEGAVDEELEVVVPFITSADLTDGGSTVTVRSFIPGLAESVGTCTASVVGGDPSETVSGAASLEVAETVCPVLVIPLLPGHDEIEVVVTYLSTDSQGESVPVGVVAG